MKECSKLAATREAESPDRKTRCCTLAGIFLVLLTAYSVQAQNSKGNWLTGPPADAFWNQMALSPYAQNGDHGMTIYMLTYSSCGNCIVFLRDFWEAHRANIQLREVFAPINGPRFLDEAADVALTRDPAIAEAYYKRIRVAPPANSSRERQLALSRVETFVTQTNAFFRSIGHVQDGYPTFVFHVKDASGHDKLWIISGWGPELARDMERWVKDASK